MGLGEQTRPTCGWRDAGPIYIELWTRPVQPSTSFFRRLAMCLPLERSSARRSLHQVTRDQTADPGEPRLPYLPQYSPMIIEYRLNWIYASHYPTCRVVRPSMALPPARLVFCDTRGVTFI